jgi:hypothetical protein
MNLRDLANSRYEDEAKTIYKSLVKKCHPDTGGSVQSFQQLSSVYMEVLKRVNGKKQPVNIVYVKDDYVFYRILKKQYLDEVFSIGIPLEKIEGSV